jgi:hypothetical protein
MSAQKRRAKATARRRWVAELAAKHAAEEES